MNKEEIEKAKEDLSFMNEGDYITREMSNSKDILIKYIESLELINETWQVSNEMFRERTKELEQKETILDKVTDKLNKNQFSDYQVLTKTEGRLRKMSRKEYDTNGHGRYLADLRDILLNRIEYQQEILNIIEGEKNKLNSI